MLKSPSMKTQSQTCSKHPHVLLSCPACNGSKGGKVLSPKKLRHLKRISKLPRPGGRSQD